MPKNQQDLAKYVNCPSPPYPANECCDQIMKGNNGLIYISKRASNGILTHAKVVGRNKLTTKDAMCKEITKLGL